jgi:hypothetical protein
MTGGRAMQEKKIIRELCNIFGVGENDLSRTVVRFKKEIEDMEKELYAGHKH